MKAQSLKLIQGCATMVVGVAAGWWIQGGVNLAGFSGTAKSSRPASMQINNSQPPIVRSDSKSQMFTNQFSTASREEKETLEAAIAPQDRKGVLEALLSQGGPRGFPDGIKEVIERLLALWGSENFEEAWAWCQQIQGRGTRNFVAGKLMNLLVETDPKRALALHLEFAGMNVDFESKVPEKILAKAALTSAEDFLKYAEKFETIHYGTGGDCEFAADFNFQALAEGLAKLKKADASKKFPKGFPSNFFETWAERDRQAAFNGGVLTGLIDFRDFLSDIGKNDTERSLDWVAQQIQSSDVSSKAISRSMHIPSESFNGIIQALPDAVTRDRFLLRVVLEGGVTGRANDIPSIAISAMSSPQARLEAFSQMQQVREKNGWDQFDSASITDADFQAWGITRQQISALFDKAPPTGQERE
jgi:hypothetical protein